MIKLQIRIGDITDFNGDAIVNAANHSLLGGGGVDGAIHHAAGPALNNACMKLNGCKTGEAKLTDGYNLPANYIIHTVGPIWHATKTDAIQLANCYRNALRIAVNHGFKTIAFPSISTGAYGYPLDQAAPIAVKTILQFPSDIAVSMVCFDERTADAYQRALQNYESGF
ncbi:O-acetyl-ADP-ribose deacetylase [Nicoliella lavandulae]|uniref:O-acetyl-ADP-ribose deacetylase n=1 Tax=Nicoliella lavandulae TaxID=3082954 RepID=A0ABU8SNG8_9LACO